MSHKRSRATYENQAARPPFALFGTPLPPLDSDARDDGSYVPLWKQDVRDERGRKRLHGAFTGGFSAGYFNTVGSKEGWAPSTFVSSKAQRHQQSGTPAGDDKRMQQYMDDEDLADLKESQKLETQGSFAGLGGANQATPQHQNGMLDLFKPTEDTIGTKLLQKMGWRQGQGIGAKVKRTIDNAVHSLAPKDTHMVAFDRKTNVFGLGFLKGDRLQADDGPHSEDNDADTAFAKPSAARRARAPAKKSGGFGVGVLNDNGSDDEDPYELGPRISYSKVVGGLKKKKRLGGVAAASSGTSSTVGSRLAGRGPKAIGQTARSSDFRRCHDGSLPIDGFVLSSRVIDNVKMHDYTPLPVPPGWVSSHLSSSSPLTQHPSIAEASKASSLDPASRAAMLGEARLPGKSVFDYMTPATRAILVAASGRNDLPQAKSESAPAGYAPPQAADQTRRAHDAVAVAVPVPVLAANIALEALARARSGWLPYAEDLDKRARYRAFIEMAAGARPGPPARAPAASTEEQANELREFVQAAQVFRPVSGLMASRFTSSTSNGQSGDGDAAGSPRRDGPFAAAPREDPAFEAAGLGMYGHLTRLSEQWFPTRLACKRFGVKPPDHVVFAANGGGGGRAAAQTGDARLDVVGQAAMAEMQRSAGQSVAAAYTAASGFVSGGTELQGAPLQPVVGESPTAGPGPGPEAGTAVDVEVNEAIEGPRAGEDLFRAVFGDSDSDDA